LFENLFPSSTLPQKTTMTNSFTNSCSNGILSIYDQRKEEDYSFYQTYADQIMIFYSNKNKGSFSINPFASSFFRMRKILFSFEFVHLNCRLFYLIFRSKVLCDIFGVFLFLYPYPTGTTFESIKKPFLLYESILL